MTNLRTLRSNLPDYAQDVKISLDNLLGAQNTHLTKKQILGAALAAAFASKRKSLILDIEGEAKSVLSKEEIKAVKAATALMAMNNVYYRFTHITKDKEYEKMSTDLSNTAKSSHGIDQIDFEIFALSVSVANGCAGCIDAHAGRLQKLGLSKKQVQIVAEIASVIMAAGQVLRIEEIIEQ